MMVMLRFIFSLAVILACLGTACLGTRASQAQDIAQEIDIAKLQRQAEQGDAVAQSNAQSNLGLMYDLGHGVPQDYAKAAAWYEKAAAQGHTMAQNNLGAMYASGQGVPQDYTKAKEWYEKAASQGFVGAQSNLGLLYAHGNGVPQDYVQAHKWLNLAAAQGNNDAAKDGAKNRDLLAKHVMTSEQIAEAQRLAREWKPVSPEALGQEKKTGTWEDSFIPIGQPVSANDTQIRLEMEALKIQAQHPYVAEIDNLPPKIRDEIWALITDEAVAALTQRGVNPADGTFNSRLALIQEKAALTNKYGPQYTGKKVGVFNDPASPSGTAQSRVARDKKSLDDIWNETMNTAPQKEGGNAVNSKPATDPAPKSELKTLIFDEEESGTPNYVAVEKPDLTLTLPTEWQEISKEILAAIHENLKRDATDKIIPKYDYGFQLGTAKDSIRYPYILIQKIEDGKISESQLKSLPKLSLSNVGSSLSSNTTMNQMYYYHDESLRIVWMTGRMDVELVGRVIAVSGMIPTKNGFLAIHTYAKEENFESHFPVLQHIIASAKIAPALSYKPYITDGLLVVDWDSIVSKAIAGGLGGGIIALFFSLISIFFGVLGRKKPS